MKTLALAAALAITLSGCASTYQPRGFSGGYEEQYRGKTSYRVSFEGNGYTRPQQAQEMAFLRAAELTLEKGHRYFVIIDENTDINSGLTVMPSTTTHRGTVDRFGNVRGTSSTVGGQAISIRRPVADLYIYMADEPFSKEHVFHDARDIVAQVGPKYKR